MTKICFILLLDTVVLVSWELVDPLQSEFIEISKEVLNQKVEVSEIREYSRFKFIFLRVTLAQKQGKLKSERNNQITVNLQLLFMVIFT